MTFGTTQDPRPDQVLHQPTVYQTTVHGFSRKRFIAFWVAAVIAVAAAFLATLPRAQSNAVINGPLVSTAPSWVAILARGDAAGNVQWCGGVLISANLLLSARHCQTEIYPNRAIIGAADLNKSGGSYAKLQAFEGYSGTDDLAVYQLDSSVSQPYILLSDTDIHLSPELVTLYGYGINTEFADPNPKSDFRLHSVDGISEPCEEDDVDQATSSEFCLDSVSETQAPCGADSGSPIVNQSGKLGAIYVGFWSPADDPRCLGSLWRAISVTTPPVRKWIADMIAKYAVHDEL
jgi:secreted trypsin-like serine protease